LKQKWGIIIAGIIVGLVSICLGHFGNPGNMQLCVACFVRDTAGAIGLHRAEPVQYIRPEVIGIILGSIVIGLVKKDFAPKGGSSPFTRFVLGICVMIGALVFLGCPTRMALRIAGGDLNALVGLVGFVGGIATGIFFLNRGFTLRRNHELSVLEGAGMSIMSLGLLALLLFAPAFIFFSETGPGSMHAPILISLVGALIVGVVAQRSRLCFIAGVRDVVLFKDFHMVFGFVAILVVVLIGNLITGNFNLGFDGQPVAHNEWIWNILGLYLVGFGATLLGGCPMRQLVLAGTGNSDSAITVIGFLVGSALVHNFGLASSGAGTTSNGRIAFFICAVVMFAIAIFNIKKGEGAK